MNIDKLAVKVNMSLEQLYATPDIWHGFAKSTPEEVAAYRVREQNRIDGLQQTWTRLCKVVEESTGLAVLALHTPNEYGSCDGDHGYEEGSPWPCRTVEAVADVYGFDLGMPR